MSAYTTREQTVYTARVFKKDVPKAIEILGDVLQNSVLDDSAINRERESILKQIDRQSQNYGEVIFDHLHESAFLGTSLGRT